MDVIIRNAFELEELEDKIATLIGRYDLDQVLAALRQESEKLKPFMIAGASLFAIRFALPTIVRGKEIMHLSWEQLAPIVNLSNHYLLADPVSFQPPIEDSYRGSTLIPIFLRIAGNQFPYDFDAFGQWARSLILFNDLPLQLKGRRGIQNFDFNTEFQRITGVSLRDFIDVGFTAYTAAFFHIGFTGGYF